MDKSIVLLEDKHIFGLNKVHKNVLKPTSDVYNSKSRVYYDPSITTESDQLQINSKLLEFVTDGLEFDQNVVKEKAAYALPYSPRYVKEIYENKHDLGNNLIIDPNKYKQKPNVLKYKTSIKLNSKNSEELKAIEYEQPKKPFKFKSKELFITEKKHSLSSSESNLAELEFVDKRLSKSLDSLKENDNDGNFFITETSYEVESTYGKNKEQHRKQEKKEFVREDSAAKLKQMVRVNWDDQLIDSLSENTARWLVMKKINDSNQRQRLIELVDQKFGKYTRDIKYLDLVEDSLTDFEKQKIAEEKKKLAIKYKPSESIKEENLGDDDDEENDKTPLYRLPQGLKRIELEKMKKPDPNYNKTAQNLNVESSRVKSAVGYIEKMHDKNVSDKTLYKTDNAYQIEMINNQAKHVLSADDDLIKLDNGKSFQKSLQEVYPADFTAWVSGIELKPKDKPEMKKPVRGKKKWRHLPSLIDTDVINKPSELTETNYWHLMPTTPDTELRKILKSNLTVAKIIDEWRSKWQITNKWSLAEIDELINDMKSEEANIRFQAVVVCSRAAEQIQLMIDKIEKFEKRSTPKSSIIINDNNNNEDENAKQDELYFEKKNLLRESNIKSKYKLSIKTSSSKKSSISSASSTNSKENFQQQKETYMHFYDLFFPDRLFQSIESLLQDSNSKVKLGAAISIFTILRKFQRPYLQKFQLVKDKAQIVLYEYIKSFNNNDRFAAAKCLACDLICHKDIVHILLFNYFNSDEQATREQITQLLANLSVLNPDIISDMVEVYLKSEKIHERILACKLLPYLKISLKNSITTKLIDLMWNDINKSVKKVAAQTLGRTGKGKQVYDEIYNRLTSNNVTDKLEALKKINHIGIMTPKLLNVYVRCFRDDYISVRELACKSSQFLNEKNDKVIESLVFMARFDRVNKLKALAIRTIGLVGDFNNDIRRCLLWALQFELDPFIRTEACHCILLLINSLKDQELTDILLERYLIEEEPNVRQEIMFVLEYLGFDSIIELPEVNKIKEQLKKLNNKHDIINRINQLDKELNFDQDIDRFIWTKKDDDEEEERIRKERKNSVKKSSIIKNKLQKQQQQQQEQEQQPPKKSFNEPPNLVFMPKQINMSKSFEETFEKIEKYIEKCKRHELTDQRDENYKNFKIIRNKSSSSSLYEQRPQSFLSKLMANESDDDDDDDEIDEDNNNLDDNDDIDIKIKSTISNISKQTKNVTPSSTLPSKKDENNNNNNRQQEFTKSSHTLLSQQIDVILEEPE